MFWVTLRQFVMEKRNRRAVIEDAAQESFRITVTTTTTGTHISGIHICGVINKNSFVTRPSLSADTMSYSINMSGSSHRASSTCKGTTNETNFYDKHWKLYQRCSDKILDMGSRNHALCHWLGRGESCSLPYRLHGLISHFYTDLPGLWPIKFHELPQESTRNVLCIIMLTYTYIFILYGYITLL